jgi:FkbM family methyltransferase
MLKKLIAQFLTGHHSIHDAARLAIPGRDGAFRVYGDPSDASVFGGLVANGGTWEPHILAIMARIIHREAHCLDIGANIGLHTLAMSYFADGGQVIAFEPVRRNFRFLRANLSENRIANVETVNAALSDRSGYVEMAVADKLMGCCFVEQDAGDQSEGKLRSVVTAPWLPSTQLHLSHERARCIRLDDWIAQRPLGRLDLIKLDVEGGEIAVLNGARRTLERYQPLLITEYNPACAMHYFGETADAYYRFLQSIFPVIRVIGMDGVLSDPLEAWPELSTSLESGRGWEDLLCSFTLDLPTKRIQ